METSDMTPEEIVEKFIAWSVDDVYNHWEIFALNVSTAAYDFAIARAREESDLRTAQMHEFIETLVKAQDLEREAEFKDLLIYTPKDWR